MKIELLYDGLADGKMLGSGLVLALAGRLILAQLTFPSSPNETARDQSAVLVRARENMRATIRSLPKYTCLETITRKYYVPPSSKRKPRVTADIKPAASCVVDHSVRRSLAAEDRVRVEVAVAPEGEIHSWPGASRFDMRAFDQMIPFGPLSTGSFGTSLSDVFLNPGTRIDFTGKTGDVFEYSYQVPLHASHCKVKGSRGWQTIAFHGSFGIDADTADLVRLMIETDTLPVDTNMCWANVSTTFHLVSLGKKDFLIPRQSDFSTFDFDGSSTGSITDFSACREYTAESTLSFGSQTAHVDSARSQQTCGVMLPAGVSVVLALTDPLDLETLAAGDAVSARVLRPVREQYSQRVWAPSGAIARGRILQSRHELKTSQYLVSIRFDRLETGSLTLPLAMRLVRDVKADEKMMSGLIGRGTEFSLPELPLSDTGSTFTFSAKNGKHIVSAGFRSTWLTITP